MTAGGVDLTYARPFANGYYDARKGAGGVARARETQASIERSE